MLPKLKSKEKTAIERKFHNKTNTVNIHFIVVDAFVALGGHIDKSGSVSKTSLI